MNSDDALLFVRLAESLSFKEAARELGISGSTASKRIALLEKELGATLISRNPRKSSLTHAGSLVLQQCCIICAAVETAQQAIHQHRMQPAGPVQVAIQAPLGAALLPALILDFVPRFPKTNLSVHLIDGQIDVIGGGFDVALTMSRKLDDSNLKAQRLATSRQVLVASPTYLKRHGIPSDVQELSKHRCLGIGHATTLTGSWRFADKKRIVTVKVRYALTSNSYYVLKCAACLDMGLLYVPELFVVSEIAHRKLNVVPLKQLSSIDWGLYALHAARSTPEMVRAIVDFIKARVPHLGQTKWVQV